MRVSSPLVSPYGRDGSRSRILHSPGVPNHCLSGLVDLAGHASRVTRHTPAKSPLREAAISLDAYLSAFVQTKVPVGTLADVLGVSHQAIRRRSDSSPPADPHPVLETLPSGLSFEVSGSGYVLADRSSDRLCRFEIREVSGSASTLPAPLLSAPEDVLGWLATAARLPLAVMISRDMLEHVVGILPGSLR